MKSSILVTLLAVLVCGCGAGDGTADAKVPAPTATVTVTATATVTATPSASSPFRMLSERPSPTAAPPRRVSLRVFRDGCGVIRGATGPDEFRNLTWVFRDADGFQVLGRNAAGETRYRYFASGTYTVVLEAWVVDRYAPVSRTVTVHC